MKIEYSCEGCKRCASPACCALKPAEICGVDKATVICGCGTKIVYPAGAEHPKYCSVCTKDVLKRSRQRHRKLDSFGSEADATG